MNRIDSLREIRNLDDVEYVLKGLGILGTGGGGPPREFGQPVMEADLAAGRSYTLVAPSEVPDEALILSGGYLGSVADPIDVYEVLERWESDFEFGRAVREMERYLGRKVDYLLSTELGGGNTIVSLTAGARLGIPVIDADTAGRAVPETHMTSMSLTDAKATPAVMIDLENNVVFTERCAQLFLDQLGRFLVTRTHKMVALVGSPMSGEQLKRGVIPGSISAAYDIGRFCSGLEGSPEEKLDRLAAHMGGWPLFYGKVTKVEADNTSGHYVAGIDLAGLGKYSQQVFRISIKNETMAGWRDGRLMVMLPDLLLMLRLSDLEGVMSSDIVPDMEMLIAGVPCHPRLREAMQTPEGTRAFSSERYGLSIPYQPIENLQGGVE